MSCLRNPTCHAPCTTGVYPQLPWRKLVESSYGGHGYKVFKASFRTPCQGRVSPCVRSRLKAVAVAGWAGRLQRLQGSPSFRGPC